MRALDVFIRDKDRRGLIRRALLRYHKNKSEYMEGALVRVGIGQFHIEQLVKLKLTKADSGEVTYDDDDFNAKRAAAEANGLKLITIHSHVYRDSSCSREDHTTGVEYGEVLAGVIGIWDEKDHARTALDFWVPQLPAKVNIVKSN